MPTQREEPVAPYEWTHLEDEVHRERVHGVHGGESMRMGGGGHRDGRHGIGGGGWRWRWKDGKQVHGDEYVSGEDMAKRVGI